jgi:hypothetical protein
MKPVVLAVPLALAAACAFYFGLQYYEEKNARELVLKQIAAERADATRRLADAEARAAAALQAGEQQTLQVRLAGESAAKQIEQLRANLSAAEAARITTEADANRAAAEFQRLLAEKETLAAHSLELAKRQSQDMTEADAAKITTLGQLLEIEQQRSSAAQRAAAATAAEAAAARAALQRQQELSAAAAAATTPPAPSKTTGR